MTAIAVRRNARRLFTALLALYAGILLAASRAQASASENVVVAMNLNEMSIEELGNIVVSSVSKKEEPVSSAPAAIYVITHDDIMRSGAASLPEMLRMAPNLHVAEITASRYAISARGFNGGTADKLLVLVDGRSVYTPFSSGVNWDLQEVPRENIERIEVVSGPGGTLWGANAVNGVINVITRQSSDANGGVLEIGGGNTEGRGSLQYGSAIAENMSYRAYVTGFQIGDHDITGTGAKARDAWYKVQGGFRFDWTPSDDLVTVQGDFYGGSEQQLTTANEDISGRNVMARWTHAFDGGSSLQVQAYYDHLALFEPGVFADYLDAYDVQIQHNFSWGSRQEIVWGAGYRVMTDNFPTILSPTQSVTFNPQSRTFGLGNVFLQDTISLTDNLKIIPGVKVEDEPYTGVEALPSVRLSWQVASSNLVWVAMSRAVRVPSRIDRDVIQTTGGVVAITGGNMQPVDVTAYEIGYRAQPLTQVSFSLSGFYNVYPNLRSAEPADPTKGVFPLVFANGMEGETYGLEFWANYRVNDWWRLTLGANWLHKDLRFKPGSFGLGGIQIAGNDPDYQVSVRSMMNLAEDVSLDIDLRNIGSLPAPFSPSYTELGARLAWRATPALEISVVGSNLLHDTHAEFGTTINTLQVGPVGVKVARRVFVNTRWTF